MKIFQPIVSGSLTSSGSIFFPSLVTSSTAVSNVVMYGTSGQLFITASSAIGGGGGGGTTNPGGSNTQIQYNNAGAFGGVDKLTYDGTNLVGTGSFTGSFTGQFNGSITTADTASHAVNFTIESTLTLNQTLTRRGNVNSTSVGNNSFDQATGSFTSAHGKYTVYKGTNARAGEFVTVWNGTTTTYYDNATTDIGNTSDITFTSTIVSGDIKINAVAASSGWTVKMLITYI
jgi:hypothetical protein